MRLLDDPSSLTTDDRFSEVATILAAGVLRLHARAARSGNNLDQAKTPNSGPSGLEVSGETVLTVHCG